MASPPRPAGVGRIPLRGLKFLAFALAALELVYLLAGNAFLNSTLGRSLANRQPEKLVADWESAWTLYPGQVRVLGLKLAGHVRHSVWSIQADAATGRLALLPLLRKELRFPEILASGVSGGATRIDTNREPPAPRPGGWTLRFERITAAGLRHLYAGDYVLTGRGDASSGFVKVMRGGPLEVLPSRLELGDGVVWRDGQRLAWQATIGARLAIARHLRAEAPGIRKLALADADLQFEATTAGLLLEMVPGQKPTVRTTEGPGSLVADLGWRHGALQPGGHLQLRVPVDDRVAALHEATLAGVDLQVVDEGVHLAGTLVPTRADSISVDADVRVRGREFSADQLPGLAQRASGHFRSRWHFDSLAWLSSLVPAASRISFDGAGTLLADLSFTDGRLDPGGFLDVPRVAATIRALGNRFTGEAHARLTLEQADDGSLQPRLDAEMDTFELMPLDSPTETYVVGQDLRIEAVSRGLIEEMAKSVAGRIRFRDARVPDLRVYNRYLPQESLRIAGGEGRLSGDLRFNREGRVGSGELLVTGRRVHLLLADVELHGDVRVETRLERADLTNRAFAADGSRVLLTGVRIVSGDEPVGTDWWSEVSLDEARLDWDRPMVLDGRLSARMKDVSLLLALYSRKRDLPDWVAKLVDKGEAEATGRVGWRDGSLWLDPFSARNDRFDVAARLRLHEKKATGDLLAHWGALSLGVELKDGQKDLHLVGASKWFEAQPGLAAR